MTANILIIDTTTEQCSVALQWQGQIYQRCELAPRDHTKKILPFVEAVLDEAGATLRKLDAIAYGRGPGSFTGLRISVATAQGLAFGAQLPMIGVSTLQAMAQACYRLEQQSQCAAGIDARMGEVYWGCYQLQDGVMQIIGQEQVIAPEQLVADDAAQHGAGTAWSAYPELLQQKYPNTTVSEQVLYPAARDMLEYAQYAYAHGLMTTADKAEPVYLRDTVTWKKLPGRE